MQNSYSQNGEDLIVSEYFGDFTGILLDVGANDGITLSNSKLLIDFGWSGHLFEPGSVYSALKELHKDNRKVFCNNSGIGQRYETVKFYESGAHVTGGSDTGLVSSTDFDETIRWRKSGVQFNEIEAVMVPFNWINKPHFDFITIDCEGNDWNVLRQIDLKEVGCRCLCIEWNGSEVLSRLYLNYCGRFGLKEIHRNRENIIFAV